MRLNKLLFLLIFGFFLQSIYAQQMPQFSMYLWNNYLINPAIGGADNSFDLKMGYRNQWVGLDGAPRSMYFTMHKQIGKRLQNDEDIDVPQRMSDRRQQSGVMRFFHYNKKKIPKAPSHFQEKGHHGIGMQVMNDRIGPFNVNNLYVSYAYHLPLGNKTYASLGAFVGVKNYGLNTSYIQLEADGKGDQAIGGKTNSISPDGTLGGLLYSDKFYTGFSINQIMNNKLDFSQIESVVQGRLAKHYYLYGGYKISLPNRDFSVVPSIMTRYLPGSAPSVDLNLKLNYMDVLWFGGSYRHLDSFIGMMGVHFNNHWDLGYSYDFNTSALSKFNNGTHEFILGYRLANKKTTGCKPSYIW